jgi:S1-C subfamily serine protease
VSTNWVDLALGLGVVVVALAGWRAGVISTVASFAGFVAGALAGAWLVPDLLSGTDWPAWLRGTVTVGGMVLLGLLGQSLLGMVGRSIRDSVTSRPVRFLDSASGMAVSAVAFLLSAWMLLSVVVSLPENTASEQVRRSWSFPALESVMAGPGGALLDDARALLASFDLPSLPFNPATLPPVGDPSGVDLGDDVVATAQSSVVQVATSAGRCGAARVGSGVMVAPERVATNAHVVGGTSGVTVRESGRRSARRATLIHLDPATDLAILHVPGLRAPVPDWADGARRGTDAAVAGYPGGGRLTVRQARVRGVATVPDDADGVRDVLVFRGLVQPGNSGGPLMDLSGRVIGLVFANSSVDESTGFALSPDEVLPAIEATRTATGEVPAGACPAPLA